MLTIPSLGLFGLEHRWRSILWIPIICCLIELLALPFCPESPAYLFRMEGSAVAIPKLVELHSTRSVSGHIAWMRDENVDNNLESRLSLSQLMRSSDTRRHVLLSVLLQISMQVLASVTAHDGM